MPTSPVLATRSLRGWFDMTLCLGWKGRVNASREFEAWR